MGKLLIRVAMKISFILTIVTNCRTKPIVDESSVIFSDIKDSE